MSIASQLLSKVRNALLLRDTDNVAYVASFKHPKYFITATINGKQEFVPISLIGKVYDRYQTLLEIFQVFGNAETNAGLNMRLKEFYKLHGMEWPQAVDDSMIGYYIKPKQQTDQKPFFDVSTIEKLSNYAGATYKASDAFLKDLGNTYADKVVDTTNLWANSLSIPNGYTVEQERYWQVAGRFKSFTWAKIYKEEYEDKKVFFSVGVDVERKELEIKLDVLRSGTHKLSNFEIRDFDYFTMGKELRVSFPIDQIANLTLDDIVFLANQFIAENKSTYEQVIDYIWNDTVDCSLFEDKLFKLSSKYTSESEPNNATINDDRIISLIISYEQFILAHADRDDLTENISVEDHNGLLLIHSFETDGKPRTILFKATSGGTTAPFEMSRKEIEYLGDNLHTFLYHIVEYDNQTGSAKLVVRKGSPTQYAELKSIHYTVEVK